MRPSTFSEGSERHNQLVRILKEHRKDGIWLSRVAQETNIPTTTLHYVFFGKLVEGERKGGVLAGKLRVVQEGKNKKLFWVGQ